MHDKCQIQVVQTLQQIDDRFPAFLLCTDNVPLGFVLLQSMNTCPSPYWVISRCLQNINGMHVPCLSSNLFAQHNFDHGFVLKPGATIKRQGPSIEMWNAYKDKSESGTDNVPSIHCTFWPNSALEWTQRSRHFGWPRHMIYHLS